MPVSLLPPGGYTVSAELTAYMAPIYAYVRERRRQGAEIAHLKPPHMNPSDNVMNTLMEAAQSVATVGSASR